ncbi:hypothetical protein Slin14017_G061330 [Septoria linicola]|nr:hypothetical protein Slin14017_G061330 [Septoria linicola]
MDATLDFTRRARHAWLEFRQPSKLNIHDAPHQGESEEQRDHHLAHDPSVNDPNQRTPLENYRLLVGIHQDKSFGTPHGFMANRRPQLSITGRPSPNLGIYSTVCDAEIKQKRNYKSQSRLINCCLGLQLIVAAALTALGAANGNRAAVTVFGAINTVIAGFLTYLKGSGLPNRLKYYQHEWTKVREYIEQRERDFSFGLLGHQHVLGEVERIREMYDAVRMDISNNTPDRFVGTMGQVKAPALQQPAMIGDVQSAGKGYLKAFDEKQAEANAAMNKVQNQASELFAQARGIKEMLGNRVHDLGQLEKAIESNGQKMVSEKKQGIAAQVEHAVEEIAHLGKELQAKATDAAAEKQQQAGDAISGSTDTARAAIAQQQLAASQAILAQQTAARDAIASTSNAASGAVAQQQQGAEAAIARTSQAATDAISQQRGALAAAIAPKHDDIAPVPTPTASRFKEGE